MTGKRGNPPAPRAKAPAAAASSYVPGTKPSLPGIYLPFEGATDLVLLQLEELERPAPEPADPWRPLRRVRLVLTAVLLGLSLGACAIDRALAFEHPVFAMLTPFAWLGVVLVWAATRRAQAHPGWFSNGVGCLGGAALTAVLVFAAFVIATSGGGASSPIAWLLGTAVALGVAWVFGSSAQRMASDAAGARERLAMACGVLHALADDAAPGKRLSGWLDVTGPDQPSKLVRESQARSGAKVQLYRDEWWRLRLPLRDGNELRVSGVERLKARREHSKRNPRGKYKRKPGRSESLRTLEVRLGVNPAVYGIKPPAVQALHIGSLTVPAPSVSAGAIAYVVAAESFTADEVLGVLAALYKQLEPLARSTGG